jgi:hypothetical protein
MVLPTGVVFSLATPTENVSCGPHDRDRENFRVASSVVEVGYPASVPVEK